MRAHFIDTLKKKNFSYDDLVFLLSTTDLEETGYLYDYAYKIKKKYVGNKVYFRGLIEYSNICRKNCLYCGIRSGNKNTNRYTVTDEEIFESVQFAWKNRFGSVVLQAGERTDKEYTEHMAYLVKEIRSRTNHEIGITLSLGEQTEEVYQQWFESGAHRYLLRIETTNLDLYKKIHPNNEYHLFASRLEALKTLKKIGYQVGTGVMIGLPEQTIGDLADDLLFFREFDIDMCGMGPYIEHANTPLFERREDIIDKKERLELSLRMIALLRILMKDINIASTTALQSIKHDARELALMVGANILMPNITPPKYRMDYQLYENKPCLDEDMEKCINCLAIRIKALGEEIGYGQWGDSKHFLQKKTNTQPL